jgi:hypothetical protein
MQVAKPIFSLRQGLSLMKPQLQIVAHEVVHRVARLYKRSRAQDGQGPFYLAIVHPSRRGPQAGDCTLIKGFIGRKDR